jgi:SAM-dependent methyltransferase
MGAFGSSLVRRFLRVDSPQTPPPLLKSSLCKQEQLESPRFRHWAEELRDPFKLHRKLWEYCYITQALHERGLLEDGRRGLGFGVGREPLVSYFASRGCEVVGTDLDPERAASAGWTQTGQHSSGLEAMNDRAICDPARYRSHVSFRVVDMNDIPPDLGGFDFTWSSCSLEHLGSIEHGIRFLERQMDCLKPGGVAVHTTEFNVSSNRETLDPNPSVVLFRRRDILALARRLRSRGHHIELDLSQGTRIADRFVDVPPYSGEYHLRLEWDRFVTTSIGLIITKHSGRGPVVPEHRGPRLLGKLRARRQSR